MRYEYACCPLRSDPLSRMSRRCLRTRRDARAVCVRRRAARAVGVAVRRGEEEEEAAKKHKTPPRKSKGKGKEALPPSRDETDEASSDEKEPTAEAGATKSKAPPRRPKPEEDARRSPPRRPRPRPKDPTPRAAAAWSRCRFGIGGQRAVPQRWLDRRHGRAGAVFAVARPRGWGSGSRPSRPRSRPTGFAANIGIFGIFNYGFGASSQDAGAGEPC